MINQALHTLDLLCWLLGMGERVRATLSNLPLGGVIEVEDTAFAAFKAHVPYTFFATNAAGASLPVEISLRMEGGTHLLLLPLSVQIDGEVVFRDEDSGEVVKACYGVSHVRLIRDFHRAAANGTHFPIDGKEAAKVVRMILAMYRSRGEEIEV